MKSGTPPKTSASRGQEHAQLVASRDKQAAPLDSGNEDSQTNVRRGPPSPHSPVVHSGVGDHSLSHELLLSVFHGPSDAEFHAQLEAPFYEPTDRLLVKQGGRPIAHLRLDPRTVQFGSLRLETTLVADLAALPEYRGRGCGEALLAAAERQIVAGGGQLALLRTKIPEFYARHGWTICGRHSYSTARPRDILSYLSATESPRSNHLLEGVWQHRLEPLTIRLWRHVEQSALMRLYDAATAGTFGPLVRSDAYWRWLLSRRGYDRIYVALEGTPKIELDDTQAPIVGYAAMKEGRIVELVTDPRRSDAAHQLVARACGDAIERDYHSLRLEGPPGDPLHRVFELAGGRHHHQESRNDHVFMVKLFDPLACIDLLRPQLFARAKDAELSRPCELGLLLGDERYCLIVGRRSVKLEAGKLGRSYLTCSKAQLTQLLLGHADLRSAVAAGQLAASTRVAAEIAMALFPRLPVWYPPWDDLPAP